jgi:hypothetical protein
MKLRMFEILGIGHIAPMLKSKKLPIKTAHSLTKIMMAANPELEFYQTEFQKIINQYGMKNDKGELIFADESKNSVKIQPGKEAECQKATNELLNLEVELNVDAKLKLEDFGNLEISVDDLMPLMPFIEE